MKRVRFQGLVLMLCSGMMCAMDGDPEQGALVYQQQKDSCWRKLCVWWKNPLPRIDSDAVQQSASGGMSAVNTRKMYAERIGLGGGVLAMSGAGLLLIFNKIDVPPLVLFGVPWSLIGPGIAMMTVGLIGRWCL